MTQPPGTALKVQKGSFIFQCPGTEVPRFSLQEIGYRGVYGPLCSCILFPFFSSVAQVMSDSLQPHGLQHTRPPCPSPIPGACSNSCPLSRRCHPSIYVLRWEPWRPESFISSPMKVSRRATESGLGDVPSTSPGPQGAGMFVLSDGKSGKIQTS